ncbi:unnamed protein product [Penicillium nalgiovense]|nr:unnamed protein product [Penicillium nalgiovense]
MYKRSLIAFFSQSFRGCRSFAQPNQTPPFDLCSELPGQPFHSVTDPSDQMMRSLLQGYRPTFKPHKLGWEAESLLLLTPSQQMCYYDGKLFGGYIALLMDRILADCCKHKHKPAFTAYLNTSFIHSVPPSAPILLRAWPEKVEGRKVFLKGSIRIPGKSPHDWIDAIQTDALFIRPKP